jgi:hypothetical protein
MTHTIAHAMTHTESHIELSVKQIIEAYGFARSTFEDWRDAVYSGVGDPPYSQDELKIILEYAEKRSAKAFGASKNKNTRKISRILRSL